MTDFMEAFPETRDREAAQIAELENRIPQILEHMS
jgi:hypothetical protein